MKTKEEIVIETIQFYGSDPAKRRSMKVFEEDPSFPLCAYNGANGTHCAFAHWVKEAQLHNLVEGQTAHRQLARLPTCLKEEVNHLSDDYPFWNSLQSLHDRDNFWNLPQGLSEQGIQFVLGAFDIPPSTIQSITFDPLI